MLTGGDSLHLNRLSRFRQLNQFTSIKNNKDVLANSSLSNDYSQNIEKDIINEGDVNFLFA